MVPMFKISRVSTVNGLQDAEHIMRRIYDEAPDHWPYGLSTRHFDGGLYLVREKHSSAPAGFVGWQERHELEPSRPETGARARLVKVGYYSIGILPEYRRNGYAREAVSKLIQMKSAGVDRV